MSKFALEGFSQCVREGLRDRKIRVINVYPAATDAPHLNDIEGNWPRGKMISPNVASAVAYALSRPADVALEGITCPVSLEIFDRNGGSDVDKATRGRVRTPKVRQLPDETKQRFPSILHEVILECDMSSHRFR
jgi:hypothetical protein